MSVRIINGDCRDVLPMLEADSVQMVCTSPPYYNLRNYQVEGQIGIEATSDEYVAQMVAVFREVHRVLRSDGTVWLNLGDTYKDKQRLMIPARVAIALQADGWWLRDEIVWHKPRPTPAPVKDRTVCAHEMFYMLSRSATYFYDWAAIEEPSLYPGIVRKAGKAFRDLAASDPTAARKRYGADRDIVVRETRRARSVWSVSPSPYTGSHFATMPPYLAEQCIRAGSRPGDTVLDPFSGAGTTALAADRLGRGAIGIELNPSYREGSHDRIMADAGLFGEVAAA
jgi:DNA modification methylase